MKVERCIAARWRCGTSPPPRLATTVDRGTQRAVGVEDRERAAGPIRYRLIGGWRGGGEQVGPDTFRIRFDRFGIRTPSDALMVMAFHPGDADHAYHEQAAVVKFPVRNAAGTTQTITAEAVPDQAEGGPPITLHASASSGLPVEYCVLSGPAEVHGDTVTPTAIPPRAKRPVRVTVVAYQWGRMEGPAVRTADPVDISFQVGGPGRRTGPQKGGQP